MLSDYSLPVTISSYRCMWVCVGVFVSICITQFLFALACMCIWGNAFWRHNQSSTANLTQLMKRKWASSWWTKVTTNTANKAHEPTHLHTSSLSSQFSFFLLWHIHECKWNKDHIRKRTNEAAILKSKKSSDQQIFSLNISSSKCLLRWLRLSSF